MIDVVERYLPGLERDELLDGLHRLQQSAQQPADETPPVRYLGSTIVVGDDACYSQVEASSPDVVIDVNRRVGLPVDRIVPAISHPHPRRIPMTVSTTVAAPVEITRRRLAALLAATIAAASALTWTVTTIAIDPSAEPTRTTTATSQNAALDTPPAVPITATPRQQVAAGAQPIVVADVYHGVGITVCPDGALPIQVADAYHGVGTTACP